MSTTTPTHEKGTEEFEFAQAGDRHVNIRNNTHETPTLYTVAIEDDFAVSCTCPDYKYRGSKTGTNCKHMAAVEDDLECDCDVLWESHGVPCWPCYRDGHKEFEEK
ncbi:SWIM zinc finger family protein [Haladaptatus sp. NG-SE-30]